ncbi:hypothetical protein KJ855_02145 [Patescibacteria group bacterium]|nr:hypothetical protein [Patescibacteria group bacterium]
MEQTGQIDSIGGSIGENKENGEKKQLIGVGELITTSFREFWRNLWVFIKVELIKYLVIFGVLVIVGAIFALFYFAVKDTLTGNEAMEIAAIAIIVGLVMVWTLVSVIFGLWSVAAKVEIVTFGEENIGAIDAYKRTWSKLFEFWWVMLVLGLIMSGGFVLLIIPAIIFGVWYSFSEFILISREERGLDVLVKSKAYTRGMWWDVFWRMAVAIAIVMGVAVGMDVIAQMISFIESLLSNMAGEQEWLALIMVVVLALVSVAVRLLVNIFAETFGLIYRYKIFKSIKSIKSLSVEKGKKSNTIWLAVAGMVLVVLAMVIIGLAGYAIWRTVNNSGFDLDNAIENLENADNQLDILEDPEKYGDYTVADMNLENTAEQINNALDEYYQKYGFYPYTDSVDQLWTGEDAFISFSPNWNMPNMCGEINTPSDDCGIAYEWKGSTTYKLTVDYLLEDTNVFDIRDGEEYVTPELDMTTNVEEDLTPGMT